LEEASMTMMAVAFAAAFCSPATLPFRYGVTPPPEHDHDVMRLLRAVCDAQHHRPH
jgi:hypothetical protein